MLMIGADIVDTDEVARSVATLAAPYVKRLFTEAELSEHGGLETLLRPGSHQLLARHFAAKEAILKLLGLGDLGVDLRSIEICHPGGCQGPVRLSGNAAALAEAAGICRILVSWSGTGGVAMAVAVATGGGTSGATGGGADGQN